MPAAWQPGGSPSLFDTVLEIFQKAAGPPGVWRHRRGPDHRHRDLSEHYPVGDIHSRLTRITLTRSSSPTTTHEAAATRSISLAHRSLPTAAPPLPVHHDQRSKPLREYPGRPRYSVQQANRNLVHYLAGRGCGGQGLGGYKSTTPGTRLAGPISAFTTTLSDDRESGWADNNPSSPFFGRMYVSWNDFNVGGGALCRRYLH